MTSAAVCHLMSFAIHSSRIWVKCEIYACKWALWIHSESVIYLFPSITSAGGLQKSPILYLMPPLCVSWTSNNVTSVAHIQLGRTFDAILCLCRSLSSCHQHFHPDEPIGMDCDAAGTIRQSTERDWEAEDGRLREGGRIKKKKTVKFTSVFRQRIWFFTHFSFSAIDSSSGLLHWHSKATEQHCRHNNIIESVCCCCWCHYMRGGYHFQHRIYSLLCLEPGLFIASHTHKRSMRTHIHNNGTIRIIAISNSVTIKWNPIQLSILSEPRACVLCAVAGETDHQCYAISAALDYDLKSRHGLYFVFIICVRNRTRQNIAITIRSLSIYIYIYMNESYVLMFKVYISIRWNLASEWNAWMRRMSTTSPTFSTRISQSQQNEIYIGYWHCFPYLIPCDVIIAGLLIGNKNV